MRYLILLLSFCVLGCPQPNQTDPYQPSVGIVQQVESAKAIRYAEIFREAARKLEGGQLDSGSLGEHLKAEQRTARESAFHPMAEQFQKHDEAGTLPEFLKDISRQYEEQSKR